MQIQATVRFHFTPVRVAIGKASTKSKRCRGGGEKGTLVQCGCECQLAKPPWRAACNCLKKVKVKLPFDRAVALLGFYPKKPPTLVLKKLCTLIFLAVQLTAGKYWKRPRCPSVHEWINRLRYLYTRKVPPRTKTEGAPTLHENTDGGREQGCE